MRLGILRAHSEIHLVLLLVSFGVAALGVLLLVNELWKSKSTDPSVSFELSLPSNREITFPEPTVIWRSWPNAFGTPLVEEENDETESYNEELDLAIDLNAWVFENVSVSGILVGGMESTAILSVSGVDAVYRIGDIIGSNITLIDIRWGSVALASSQDDFEIILSARFFTSQSRLSFADLSLDLDVMDSSSSRTSASGSSDGSRFSYPSTSLDAFNPSFEYSDSLSGIVDHSHWVWD